MNEKKKMALSYGEYLRLPELLDQQRALTDAHDELQFIVVHQAFELWFKLILHELSATRAAMDKGDAAETVHYMRRVHEIMRVLIASWDVIETMRPWDFLAFRSNLQPASGFQSVQFRELEYLSGLKDERYVKLLEGGAAEKLRRRLSEPTLWDAYVSFLRRHALPVNTDVEIRTSVITILKDVDHHPLGAVTEALIEYDEVFSIFRYRHMRMAMRMIGGRPGTGSESVARLEEAGYGQMGPGGVDYLKTTLPKLFFPILWEARTFIER